MPTSVARSSGKHLGSWKITIFLWKTRGNYPKKWMVFHCQVHLQDIRKAFRLSFQLRTRWASPANQRLDLRSRVHESSVLILMVVYHHESIKVRAGTGTSNLNSVHELTLCLLRRSCTVFPDALSAEWLRSHACT